MEKVKGEINDLRANLPVTIHEFWFLVDVLPTIGRYKTIKSWRIKMKN